MFTIGPHSMNEGETWMYALLGGLMSIPVVIASYWQTGTELSLAPILVGGFCAGYLAERKTGEGRGVGLRAGLIGGLPILWVLAELLAGTSGLVGPSWFAVGGTVLTVGFVCLVGILGFGLAAFIGEIGARIGRRMANDSTGPQQPPATGS